jgi:hypothetical protein
MRIVFESRRVRRSVVIAVGALTLGASIGVIVSSEVGGASTGIAGLTPGATFPENSDGLTYGSSLGALDEAGVPDLILVVATNGKQGYVYRSALNAADGSDVSTLQEASDWDEVGATESHTVPVFAEDGTTVIGTFTVSPAVVDPVPPGGPANTR